MADAFDGIVGQPKVRDFLRSSLKAGRVSHAYLFTGPSGSNKTMAAYALARAIMCPKGPDGPRGGNCGACIECGKIMRKKHPDVHYHAPEGANGYLVEQIREIVNDVSLAPIQASRKVYIIDRVDLLGVAAANAFLKTLEEPPADVVMILLGRTREGVLPTIVSRCQIVPFRHIPASEAAAIVAQNTGASNEMARIAIESCGGSITKAVEFLRASGNERLAFRSKVLDTLSSLQHADDWDIVCYAASLVTVSKAPLDSAREDLELELAENADFLSKSAIRQIEARIKRQLSAKSMECLQQLSAIVRSWLRDVLAIRSSAEDLVVNVDAIETLRRVAHVADEARIICALKAVDRCDEAFTYNASPETCIDALLFEVREVFNGSGSAD